MGNDRPNLSGAGIAPAAGLDKRVWFNSAAFLVNDVGGFGTLGRNAVYGPKLYSFDMGFFKNFKFSEAIALQFRAEMFNIFNQTNFANPNATVTGGGFGSITNTIAGSGDPRILQFGLKLSF